MSEHGVLGENTTYPTTYTPESLYAIPRSLGREAIVGVVGGSVDRLALGVDWWQAFEVSWLNPQGISQVAMARFSIPASSPNIVESKSLKLYLNGLNFTQFKDWATVTQTLVNDLSACVEATVEVELFDLDETDKTQAAAQKLSSFLLETVPGDCIDRALDDSSNFIPLTTHPDARLLKSTADETRLLQHVEGESEEEGEVGTRSYRLYSNLLRSNCPVTNQPDWGTLAIDMTTDVAVNKTNLLQYILSFRQHNGFHEQCVEHIFADLKEYFKPSKLMVRAWYTRRGGIDINPCRVNDMSLLPKPSRLIRQ